MEQRPTSLTKEMRARIGREMAADLEKSGHIEKSDFDEVADAIAKASRGPYMDGYALAKELEDRYCMECNLQIANDLDSWSSLANKEIKAAQKEWAERNNVMPPFKVGARVKTSHGEIGTIDEIYPHDIAKYCVKVDGDRDKSRRSVVAFEDVTLLEASVTTA